MKSVTTKLLLSFAVISMAIIALSTVTLAWFTLSKTAKVNQFELNIKPDDGLEIRVIQERLDYDSGWRINTQTKLDGALVPVTTLNGKKFKNFDFTDALSSHYISFKIYFRSKVDCSILLSKMSSSSSDALFKPDVDIVIKEDSKFIIYGPKQENKYIRSIAVSDAFRASFIINDTPSIYVFNKDKGQGCYAGFEYQDNWYNPAIEFYNKNYGTNLINPFRYMDLSSNLVDEKDFISGKQKDLYLYNIESISSKMRIININDELLTLNHNNLSGYYEGDMQVNIWLEGWDADCFDAINNTTLSMVMGFTKKDN